MKYRLPCKQCGEEAVIDISQAGRQLVCRCGATVEIPSLRAIRALEPATEVRERRPTRSWTQGRGIVFAVGLVIAVLGLLAAGSAGTSWYRATGPTMPPPEAIEAFLADVDEFDAPRAWDAWIELRDQGLGPYYEPPHSRFETSVRRVFGIFIGGLVAAGAGIAAALLSMFLPGRSGAKSG